MNLEVYQRIKRDAELRLIWSFQTERARAKDERAIEEMKLKIDQYTECNSPNSASTCIRERRLAIDIGI